MTGRRPPPAERVRARLARVAGEAIAAQMPAGYQRLGSVLIVRLPPALAPYRTLLGEGWQEELGVATVLARTAPIDGELREPRVETLAGGPTETVVVEHGSRYRLDARRTMFAAGNRTERQRFASLVRPGERVADLFAGIGYFTVPAARRQAEATFVAVEKNPVAYAYLVENLRSNGVADRVLAILGDNRRVPLPPATFDRVLLGYLPSGLPWAGTALRLLRPRGGAMHVHLVADAKGAPELAAAAVSDELRARGAAILEGPRAREVKPYGPGRTHVVVDVRVRPA
jgi:tRNA wybutosine-synthesizing protein 2